MKEITIQKNEAGQRFDKFLAKYMNQAPKSFFYKMLRKKNITLNGKKAAGNEILKLNDTRPSLPSRRDHSEIFRHHTAVPRRSRLDSGSCRKRAFHYLRG